MANGDNAFGGFGESLSQGIQIASQLQQVEQNKAKAQEDRQKFELQKGDRIFGQLQQSLLLPDGVRKAQMKRIQNEAQMLGVNIAPETLDLFNDPATRQSAVSGMAALAGLDDNQRGPAMVQALSTFADPIQTAKLIQQVGGREAQFRQGQQKAQAMQNQIIGKELRASQDFIGKHAQADINALRSINAVFETAQDPARRKEAFAGDTARVLFAKILDPKTGVREGEVARLTGLGGGALESIVSTIKRALSGDTLNETQWSQILELSNIIGKQSQGNISRLAQAQAKPLSAVGLKPDDATAAFPGFKEFDFQTAGINRPATLRQLQARAGTKTKESDVAGLKSQRAGKQVADVDLDQIAFNRLSAEDKALFEQMGALPGTAQFKELTGGR